MDHSEAERQVLLTTRAYLLEDGSRDGAVNRLVEEGLSEVASNLRADLVPMAFGWVLLKKVGVEKFPSYFELTDTQENVRVSDSHVFTAALSIAVKVFEEGYNEMFSKRVVEMLVQHSAEVDALNKALNSDPNLDLSEVTLASKLSGYSSTEYNENA